jgi:hypothetical protein
MLGAAMETLLVTLQLMLLLSALPLAVMSYRTPRSQRSRHGGFMAVASLLGLLAVVLALVQLSLVFAGEEDVDSLMEFAPPLFTLLACGMALRRGLATGTRRSRRAHRK